MLIFLDLAIYIRIQYWPEIEGITHFLYDEEKGQKLFRG